MNMAKQDEFYAEMKKIRDMLDRALVNYSQGQIERAPAFNLTETESSIVLTVELPGVDKKDIDLQINNSNIEVSCQTSFESEKESQDQYRYTAQMQSYYRNVPLPQPIDSTKAVATFKKGVLKIEAPKMKKGKSSKLDIK
jgi:HSP20 family protein